jgi:E3 ubiquitin-protein ligase MARCH6
MMDSELSSADICRVCRSEGLPDRPLFHPCICTGSIKWIHQECLMQWMRYSRKEYCELCSYRFSFTPIYSPDMPRRLPVKDLAAGLLSSIGTAIKYWLHYTLVAIAWLGIVPLTACRIYRALFAGTVDAILTLPFELLSMENLASDIFQGCFVVTCTLFAFAGLVWLREQILHGGGPDWLQRDNAGLPAEDAPPPVLNNNIPEDVENVEAENEPQEAEGAVQPQENPPDPQEENEANGGEDNNWIPMEWDRAAEEITWERLLGLDGSLMFLEHVFWVISLNTLFILIFAYSPYHMGLMTLSLVNMRETASASHFEGLLTTLVGYCTVGLFFVFFHRVAGVLGLYKAKRVLGLC